MALLGSAVLANWGGVLPGTEDDYNVWHSLEHLSERLAVPGFLRGRRGIAPGGGNPERRYFMMYEVTDADVLVSDRYLARLNDPTAWTQRVLGTYLSPCRTVCRVKASAGRGLGGWCATVLLSERVADLDYAGLVAAASDQPGIVAAHGLEGDPHLGQGQTAEKAFRESQGQPDTTVAAAFLVEGYDPDLTARAIDSLHDQISASTGDPLPPPILYQIQHVVGRQD